MKKKVMNLRCSKPVIEVMGQEVKLPLPKGCLGACWVFESKKSARDFFGEDADNLVEVRFENE